MNDFESRMAESMTKAMGETIEEVARPVTMVPITVEIEQAEIDALSRVLYCAAEQVDGGESGIEVGVRVIFVFGESVANALVFGHLDQAGDVVPHSITIQSAGMTAIGEDNQNDLVTMAFESIKAFVASHEEVKEDGYYDPLTLLNLDIDLPHNVG